MKVPERTIFRDIARVLQYAPVVIFFFLSFSFWKKGLTEPAIIFGLMGIGLILLVFLLGITQKIIGNKRRFVIVCAVLLISIGLYSLITGDLYPGIALTLFGIAFILETILPGKRWQIGITVVVLLTLGTVTYLEHFSGDKTHTVGREVGMQQGAVDKTSKPHGVPSGKASASDSPRHPIVNMMDRFLTPEQRQDPTVQKMMEIMDSDSFQQQLQTLKEFYQFLASQGVTELSEIAIDKALANSYRIVEANYKAKNPGKAPADEDEVMASRLAAAIDKYGHVKGMNEFMSDNGMWLSLRFHGDEEALNKWWVEVRAKYEAGDFTTPSLAPTDPSVLGKSQEGIPFKETTPDLPLAKTETEPSDLAPSEAREEPTRPDTEPREVTAPKIEPETVITEKLPEPPAIPTEAELEAKPH